MSAGFVHVLRLHPSTVHQVLAATHFQPQTSNTAQSLLSTNTQIFGNRQAGAEGARAGEADSSSSSSAQVPMVRFLEQEVDEIRDVVADIVSTMVKRKASKKAAATNAEQEKLAKLADDLAAMGITTADKALAAPRQHECQQRPVLHPEQQRVQQVMVELQHNLLRLQQSLTQGAKDVGTERYDIGYSLGTLVRLYFGPTCLQSNPQALPEAFALALQQTYVAAGSNLQLLIDGLACVSV